MSRPTQLSPADVLFAYTQGAFPMATGREGAIQWYTADPRAIMPLETFHVPHSLRRIVRKGVYEVTSDQAFEHVIRACAESHPGREETWISEEIIDAYVQLHAAGYAHSVEAWRINEAAPEKRELVGGLYGVALGGVFFGESMFSRADDASKVCLVHLIERMRRQGFVLLDVQFNNPHLARFGVQEVERKVYEQLLHKALAANTAWC